MGEFVEKYVVRIREILPFVKFECQKNYVHAVSQRILDSDQGNFFLKLISDLPEKANILARNAQAVRYKMFTTDEGARALMRCATCKKMEHFEKQFKKCNRCKSVFYCGTVCQKADWPSHKTICR